MTERGVARLGRLPDHSRVASKWIRPSLVWTAVIVIAVALGRYAKAPSIPGMPHGRMLPRVPQLPPNLSELLFMLGVGSIIWYATIFSIPLLLLAARRVRWRKENGIALIAGVIAVFAALFVITAGLEFVLIYSLAGSKPPFVTYLAVALRQDLVPWIAVAAIVTAIELRRRSVRATVERERLRAQVAEQRLVALTGQLQPHFLFNTLQGISTLIHRDPEAADEVLSRLSDLLRDLLRHRDTPLVSLEDELRYIRTYLEISKVRFSDRLNFTIDSDPSADRVRVPLFILQPLVENALHHGIGSRAEGGTIAVRAMQRDRGVTLEVEDDGNGLTDTSDGVGLSNTRERLKTLFGDDQTLTIARNQSGGVTARIVIPVT
ncbi:MAG TPA: histidine kinase [Gemmatimonadaceae bacterium]